MYLILTKDRLLFFYVSLSPSLKFLPLALSTRCTLERRELA